jgi:hypothetical protein
VRRSLRRTWHRLDYNTKMDLKDAKYDDVDGMTWARIGTGD